MTLAYEQNHRRALAREMTAAAGFPLRDRYGYAANDATVDLILDAVFSEPDDTQAAVIIGTANATGDCEFAAGYDTFPDEAYEAGIVAALRPLVEQRRKAAAS